MTSINIESDRLTACVCPWPVSSLRVPPVSGRNPAAKSGPALFPPSATGPPHAFVSGTLPPSLAPGTLHLCPRIGISLRSSEPWPAKLRTVDPPDSSAPFRTGPDLVNTRNKFGRLQRSGFWFRLQWPFCRGARGPEVVLPISDVLIPLIIIIPWRPNTLISAHPLFATLAAGAGPRKSRLPGECNDGRQRDRRASEDSRSSLPDSATLITAHCC